MTLITGKAKVCGVIGDPIEHTMSPPMQNAAFSSLGLDYLYVPFHVKKEALSDAIEGMRALKIRGLNVTIPHKVDVMCYLDKIDPLAEKIGAINTISNDDGVLTGYNTDATGFLQALLESGIKPDKKNIVILGAGGASRGISFILAEKDAEITILNRELEFDWALDLAKRISETVNCKVEALLLNDDNLKTALSKADILINTTSVGMIPDTDKSLVPKSLIRPEMLVFDIVYNPVKTKLMAEAEGAGARTMGGANMLVWQGALSLELWTGKKAPVELMKKITMKMLEEREK